MSARVFAVILVGIVSCCSAAMAQRLEVPRRHDRPPGPPLSPEEAVARMTVPEGFSVEIVAAEPDVVNPVAMFIDEQGRFWITESFEYPRKEPGPGRDRIKVLEDTDGDGKVDKVTVFADGLNIPSGIAVGYGGVWVANAPDILFMQDTDGDLKADKIEMVMTGFGRTDTHELPNSFTWGPDGWLYGLNGVFNYCDVDYAEENPNYAADHPGWQFTCAMFRIHPRTREFQIFAEGTSNPWGIAINDEGDFFISACVIDHLWHIVETGYYIRQGGPYPPHTWPMRSIVDHKHQKAAYCGLTWFDSDAYPEEYRKVLYMGNIHGGCINADVLERSGSTYKAKPHPGFPAKPQAWVDDEYDLIRKTGDPGNPKLADFLTANDAWFMPVVQTTGPDGCLYILDWYDRYHCYQDANADPAGIDRGKGRLYRVRYKDTPHAQPFDLAEKSDEQLIDRLQNGSNEYIRSTSRRLLAERLSEQPSPRTVAMLTELIDDRGEASAPQNRLRALWTLGAAGLMTEDLFSLASIAEENPTLARWAIRLASDQLNPDDLFDGWGFLHSLQDDPSVTLQVMVGISKSTLDLPTKASLLAMAAKTSADDSLAQHVAWENLLPLIQRDPNAVLQAVEQTEAGLQKEFSLAQILPRLVDVVCQNSQTSSKLLSGVVSRSLAKSDYGTAKKQEIVDALNRNLRLRSLSGDQVKELRSDLIATAKQAAPQADDGLRQKLTTLQALLGDEAALRHVRERYADTKHGNRARLDALETLIAASDQSIVSLVDMSLSDENTPQAFVASLIDVLGRVNDPAVGEMVLSSFESLDGNVKPKAIEVLTQRPEWSAPLLRQIADKKINKDALNLNQLKRVALFKQDEVKQLVAEIYGAVRQDGRSDRQHVINRMRDFLNGTPGDPDRGIAAYKKVCGQCHKIYGDGAEVGPDITSNGRNNWEQLLQNVFDPSAVIGPGYQARTLVTEDGRVLTGLPVEESDQRIVLKIQGGKTETIPRDQIEAYAVSEMSMMPEDLEKQLQPQEIADLFSFLALDKPPSDPEAKLLPGAPQPQSR